MRDYYADLWELKCQEHEEKLERDTAKLFELVRAFVFGSRQDTFSITDSNGDKITVKFERGGGSVVSLQDALLKEMVEGPREEDIRKPGDELMASALTKVIVQKALNFDMDVEDAAVEVFKNNRECFSRGWAEINGIKFDFCDVSIERAKALAIRYSKERVNIPLPYVDV